MSPEERKRATYKDLGLAAILVTTGLVIAGLSVAELRSHNPVLMAQGTGTPDKPLQATPTPAPESTRPAESKPGGTRPTTPAPEPARPDPAAQKQGAKPALPPAPAEKMAPPIEKMAPPTKDKK